MTIFEKAVQAVLAADIDLDGAYLKPAEASWLARAVLMAVRDLDENNESDAEVLIKGRAVMPEHDEPLLEDAAETFAAMIDAILSEDAGTSAAQESDGQV